MLYFLKTILNLQTTWEKAYMSMFLPVINWCKFIYVRKKFFFFLRHNKHNFFAFLFLPDLKLMLFPAMFFILPVARVASIFRIIYCWKKFQKNERKSLWTNIRVVFLVLFLYPSFKGFRREKGRKKKFYLILYACTKSHINLDMCLNKNV